MDRHMPDPAFGVLPETQVSEFRLSDFTVPALRQSDVPGRWPGGELQHADQEFLHVLVDCPMH